MPKFIISETWCGSIFLKPNVGNNSCKKKYHIWEWKHSMLQKETKILPWSTEYDNTWKMLLLYLQNLKVVIPKNGNIERLSITACVVWKEFSQRTPKDRLSGKQWIYLFTKLANKPLTTRYTTLMKCYEKDLGMDINSQLPKVAYLDCVAFSLQFDELTNFTDTAQLMVVILIVFSACLCKEIVINIVLLLERT